MAQEYTIKKVSEQQPREYKNDYGTTYYIKVMLDGHDKPVEIGKKKPDGLKEGYKVYGTIEATEYETDRFKPEKNPSGYSGGGASKYQPRDDEAIRAQWSIGQAMAYHIAHKTPVDVLPIDVEQMAKELFAMVERVKESNPKAEGAEVRKQSQASGYERAKAVRSQLPVSAKADEVVEFDENEAVDYSDIPF